MNEKRDLLVRYGEIALKGKNRRDFEKALANNLKHALHTFSHGPVERPRGRIIIRDVEDAKRALKRVSAVPGVMSVSIAVPSGLELEAIHSTAIGLMEEALAQRSGVDPVTFKVSTTRSFKGFPMNSMELSAEVGGVLLQRFPCLKARMKGPEILLQVEVRAEQVLLSALHCKGPGGLPVGSTGRVMVLLSGGIDSPVAAYLAMKRGARAYFINFHSYPFIPHKSLDKVKDLVRRLAFFQGKSLLFVAPFKEIQIAIKKNCREELRTLLYRRMMRRLAERAAAEAGALALVTGESLGQVASQTLENIGCIGAATRLPVLRPLIGLDKIEAISLANRIDTYDISILPLPDCCTVFQPRNPKIRGSPAAMESAEERLDVEGLVEAAFSGIERVFVEPSG